MATENRGRRNFTAVGQWLVRLYVSSMNSWKPEKAITFLWIRSGISVEENLPQSWWYSRQEEMRSIYVWRSNQEKWWEFLNLEEISNSLSAFLETSGMWSSQGSSDGNKIPKILNKELKYRWGKFGEKIFRTPPLMRNDEDEPFTTKVLPDTNLDKNLQRPRKRKENQKSCVYHLLDNLWSIQTHFLRSVTMIELTCNAYGYFTIFTSYMVS